MIYKVGRPDELQFRIRGRKHIVFALDNVNAALRTQRNSFANRFDFDSILASRMKYALTWSES